jgi:predicted nucleotidyltransferase
MAKIRKTETVTDINFYEAELNQEQLELYKENEEAFWEKYGDEIESNFELTGDNVGDPDNQYELIEE